MKLSIEAMVHVRATDKETVVFSHDMSKYGYIMVGTKTLVFDFELPSEKEQTRLLIENLRGQQQAVLAECHRKTAQIQEQIDSLLCLDHKGGDL